MPNDKKQRGRPRYNPTDKDRKIVSFASAIGTPQETIGKLIGISHVTLRQYYQEELDLGTARANLAVADNLYSIATGSTPQAAVAAMFWMKTRAGWREIHDHTFANPDGTNIEHKTVIIIPSNGRD